MLIYNQRNEHDDSQATASAADLSSTRCFDDRMLERFADAIVALGIIDSNFACLSAWIFEGDALETFARFQAGFLSSKDYHRFLSIFIDFHGFPSMSVYIGKSQPAAPIETFARFQAGFLSSEGSRRFLSIFIDLYDFHGFL